MKVLVYGNRKQGDMMWDVSTPEKEDAAFLALFRYLGDVWKVYSTLNEDLKDREREFKELEEVLDAYAKKSVPAALMKTAKMKLEDRKSIESSLMRIRQMAELLKKAQGGDAKAAKKLLSMRKGYEYEEWHIAEVMNPVPKEAR
ncbi:MAG: hypothetical protein ACRD2L_06840 [Terriglobia bacterium]